MTNHREPAAETGRILAGDLRPAGWWGRGLALLLSLFLATLAPAEVLTVATYNVENYGPANRMVDGQFRPAYPKPEAEKTVLRAVMRSVAADIWILEEMGPGPYLEELRRDLRSEGADFAYSAIATGPDAERHVAILSKRPLLDVETVKLSFPYLGGVEQVKRGVLRATVKTTAGDITLFGVHLKSRLTERPDDPESGLRRAAEATAVRDAILRRFPEPSTARFIVIGDCNDTKASKALLHLQRRGQNQIALLLPAVDSKGETWTYFYKREDSYARIDHILLSPALWAAAQGNRASIYDGPDVLVASDHRPVFVRLVLDR
jgi:endonuclease/exonuclease/phosphatase family metal-dependent hydrolase